MAIATHVLDTSAILAHYFEEPGAEEVETIWQDADSCPAICVLTIPELRTRLLEETGDSNEVERVMELYVDLLSLNLSVDKSVAERATELRSQSPNRIPLVDACIAACASWNGAVLVHRDPHMDELPAEVKRIRLPDRS